MLGDATYNRAERLDVLLTIYGSQRISADEALAFLDREEFYKLADTTSEDEALVNACLDLEAELAERDWAALERLLAEGVLVGRYPEPQLSHLSMPRRALAVCDLIRLGWIDGMHLLP